VLGDFNSTVGREDILNPSVADEISPEVIDDIGVTGVVIVHLKPYLSRALNGFLVSQHS
jgi:hypothetical protein